VCTLNRHEWIIYVGRPGRRTYTCCIYSKLRTPADALQQEKIRMASDAAAVSNAIDPATMNSRRCHVHSWSTATVTCSGLEVSRVVLRVVCSNYRIAISGRIWSSQQLSSIAILTTSSGSTPIRRHIRTYNVNIAWYRIRRVKCEQWHFSKSGGL